jgi:hypothetical protein
MKLCLKPKASDLLVIDVFVHIIILLTVIFIFYFVMIAPLESEELTNQISNQINNNMDTLYKEINNLKGMNGEFKKIVKQLNKPGKNNSSTLDIMSEYYSKPDNNTKNWNLIPFFGTIIVLIALLCGFFAIWGTLTVSCNKCIPVGRIIIENIILFGLIGVIEAVFFTFIAKKYVPVKPSYFVNETINSLKETFNRDSGGVASSQ